MTDGSKADEIGQKIKDGVADYSELVSSILDNLGPAIEKVKDAASGLIDKLRQDDKLDAAQHAELLGRLDSLYDELEAL